MGCGRRAGNRISAEGYEGADGTRDSLFILIGAFGKYDQRLLCCKAGNYSSSMKF
uniref:Uncharacterized protein n=1 Tax=Ascaris lumbricoides TaxID=6252 RepID=A0A0M3IU53_ASCLU